MTTINTSNMIPFTPLPVPLTWFVSGVESRLAPQNQTAVTVAHDVKTRPPTSGQPATGVPTYAPNVASLSQNPKSDMRRAIAPQPVKNEPNNDDTGSEKEIKSPIYTVYVLKHPVSGDVFYVGSTKNVKKRTDDYNGKGRGERVSGRVLDWLSTLPSPPILETVETCPINKIREREQFWIEYYRVRGAPLLNVRDAYNLTVRVCECVVCHSLFYTFNKAKYCGVTCKKTAAKRRRRGTPDYGPVAPPNSRGFVDPPQVGECAHCGRPLTRKSRNGRLPKYCGTSCRVAHWRQRQKDGGNEAGGGRVAIFIILALVVFALWFFWPLLKDLAAMRPTLPVTPTAVPIYPAPRPESPQPAPTAVPQTTPQAAPETTVTAVSPAPAVATNDVKPAPVAVPVGRGQAAPATPIYQALPPAVPPKPEVAATAGAALLRITANGKVYELTGERLIACINAQQNGQRTAPSCPPNAAAYAGMLGQGR